MGDNQEKLTALRCKACGTLYIPPRYLCPVEDSGDFEEVPLIGRGKILSHTTIRVPPLGFENQVPYDIAVIELDEGINLSARIVGDETVRPKIGDGVHFVKKENGAHYFEIDAA